MLGDLRQTLTAARLAVLANSVSELADADILLRVSDLLIEYTPEQRAAIGAQAVTLGASPETIKFLLNLIAGEVINVSGKAPGSTTGLPWAWILGLVGLLGVGGYAYSRHRRKKPKRLSAA